MPQSLARILVHLIFSTKNREPFLNVDLRAEPAVRGSRGRQETDEDQEISR